jgi:hypothetical protein
MSNSNLMTSVSLETLGVMLASSLFIAESIINQVLCARRVHVPVGEGAAPSINGRPRGAFDALSKSGSSVIAFRRAERLRTFGLSPCVNRARVRFVIRIRGRR